MNAENKNTITNFIEQIWNQNRFEKIDSYLSPGFIDHSLPPDFPANAEGMKRWVMATGKFFVHQTIIDEMICEDHKVMLKINMQLKHIGAWRGIEATHFEISTVGYRYYRLENGKIMEHWGLIDGNAIENQLKDTFRGCKIQA